VRDLDVSVNGRREELASGAAAGQAMSSAQEPHPVVQILLDRARTDSKPGARSDPHRVALVIEGGAMRGVVSGGMATGLEALGLRDAFDVVYGASAGACAAAYFLAGQAQSGARLYYEAVNNRQFIDVFRGLQRRAIVDLDFLFDEVLRKRHPLDFEAVQRSGVDLVILASHVDGQNGAEEHVEAVRFSDFEDADDLMGALHASCRMPIVGGAPFTYRGMRYWDAAITQPVPIHAALADGCTHILVLLTLPRDIRPGKIGLLDRLLLAPRVASASPSLGRMYTTRSDRYRETCHMIFTRSSRRDGPPYVEGIAADTASPVIGRTEVRTARLIAAARAGGQAVLSAFGRPDARLDERLVTVDARGNRIDVRLAARRADPTAQP
jgi:predicted patatin/cPLA2 family phospholipase